MRKVLFVFICVFIFFLHQAETQKYGVPSVELNIKLPPVRKVSSTEQNRQETYEYEETNSHTTYTDYTSPIFIRPIRIKRQTHNVDYSNGVNVPNYSYNYYRNTSKNHNQMPVNSYGSHPKRQYEPNLENQFKNYPVQGSNNTKPDILITQNTKRANITNDGGKFRNDNPNPSNFKTQNTRRGYTDRVSIVNFGNGQGKNNIVDLYERRSGNSNGYFHITDTRNTRRGTTVTNIGNGIGNRNIIYLPDNVDVLHRSDTASRRPASRRPTNTQQTNNRPNWNQINSNSRKKNNPSFNNGQVSRIYTRMGQGTDNTNIVYINGVPILSNSGVTISETNHQGRTYQKGDINRIPNNKSNSR